MLTMNEVIIAGLFAKATPTTQKQDFKHLHSGALHFAVIKANEYETQEAMLKALKGYANRRYCDLQDTAIANEKLMLKYRNDYQNKVRGARARMLDCEDMMNKAQYLANLYHNVYELIKEML